MTRWFTLVGKGLVIAICAAIAAWAYIFALTLSNGTAQGMDWLMGEAAAGSFLFALFGTCAVGLPIALLTFLFSGRHLAQSFTTLAIVAVLAGIMLVLASYVLAREDGVLVLGIPAFIAALMFGLLGWLWILKPMRKDER